MYTNGIPKRTLTTYMPGIELHSFYDELHHLERYQIASTTQDEHNCVV